MRTTFCTNNLFLIAGSEGGQGRWQASPCKPDGKARKQGCQEGQEVDVVTAVPLDRLDCRCQSLGGNVLKNNASFRYFSCRKDEGKVEKEADEETEEKEEEDESKVLLKSFHCLILLIIRSK